MSDAHPRDRFDLIPAATLEASLLDALERGRMHHAWLLCGVEGLGKATFAYRAARRLLGAAPDAGRGPLGARPDDPVSRMISAQSHPDLLVLEKLVEGGKVKKSISVDQARQLPDFFAHSSSLGGRRIAIVDATDDLNINAANALLKVLEEPPEGGVLFLIAHSPGRLLATIRSRCRRLTFPTWSEADIEALLTRRGVPRDEAPAIAHAAGGSPGAAIHLATGASLEEDQMVDAWTREGVGRAEALAVADSFRGGEGAEKFDRVMERLGAAVGRRAREGQA
ncbi:MAG: DNA polymerase III subunit delta', partial [Brevundimonas sp.]